MKIKDSIARCSLHCSSSKRISCSHWSPPPQRVLLTSTSHSPGEWLGPVVAERPPALQFAPRGLQCQGSRWWCQFQRNLYCRGLDAPSG